jgi:hypothetical protein
MSLVPGAALLVLVLVLAALGPLMAGIFLATRPARRDRPNGAPPEA